MVFIDWDDSLRSASYRVVVTNGATPPAELKNIIVTESEVTINDIPAATAITVTVAGRNSKGGESSPSAPVISTVP